MKNKNKKIIIGIVIGVVVTSGIFFLATQLGNEGSPQKANSCQNLPELPNNATKRVTKVIDGDTFIIEGGHSVRLLGIDADENGYSCYEEAKRALEEMVLNEKVSLRKGVTNYDQYCRYLRYPFIDDKNVSLQLVKKGLAIARFNANQTKFKEAITEAEQNAQEKGIGCKWQKSASTKRTATSATFTWQELTGEVVGPCQAGKYKEENLIVEGKIAGTYHDAESNTVFLNFTKPYPDHCFNAVIFSSNLHKFVESPEDFYLNKTVRVKGKVKMYQGKPEIILEDPNQIEVGG